MARVLRAAIAGVPHSAVGSSTLSLPPSEVQYSRPSCPPLPQEVQHSRPTCSCLRPSLPQDVLNSLPPSPSLPPILPCSHPSLSMLVQLCKTLDEVPKERFIFCRLVYHDCAPDDYEPQFFRSMDASELGHFPRKPFTM